MKLWPLIGCLLLTGCEKFMPVPFSGTQSHGTGSLVYVLAGQSNMTGSFQGPSFALAPGVTANGGEIGPGYIFGAKMAQRMNRPVLLIQCAANGSGIERWKPGGDLYQGCLAYVATKGVTHVDGIVWYQGETEAGLSVEYPWAQTFTDLINSMRKALGNSSMPVLYAQIGALPSDYPEAQYIRDQQRQVTLTNSRMVETMDLPTIDGVHHTTEANRILGERFALAAE